MELLMILIAKKKNWRISSLISRYSVLFSVHPINQLEPEMEITVVIKLVSKTTWFVQMQLEHLSYAALFLLERMAFFLPTSNTPCWCRLLLQWLLTFNMLTEVCKEREMKLFNNFPEHYTIWSWRNLMGPPRCKSAPAILLSFHSYHLVYSLCEPVPPESQVKRRWDWGHVPAALSQWNTLLLIFLSCPHQHAKLLHCICLWSHIPHDKL